jgi:hypothetical protein
MPASRRARVRLAVSLCEASALRAITRRRSEPRASIQSRPTSPSSETSTSRRSSCAAAMSASAASTERRMPPNRSSSHEASKPSE